MHGAEKSADFLAADEWIRRDWPKIITEYLPEDTYNADETGLYFSAMLEHTYLFKNESAKGFKSSKERVTVLCFANMKGEKRDLLVKILDVLTVSEVCLLFNILMQMLG
jgi:hypothetical protein